ncbi:protein disulfide isomerase CRELD2-like isoform X2 [Halichondria panicea]|uniref:protein disulfide isomerase CRELD2-like isoform X2 n=1 Tax=Halichondria panicea TaxID=6063 RepID=UPI00312BAF11
MLAAQTRFLMSFYTAEYYILVCDKACLKECGGPGADSCKECALGYEEVEGSCTDIDECREDDSICSNGTYCLNTPGCQGMRAKLDACPLKELEDFTILVTSTTSVWPTRLPSMAACPHTVPSGEWTALLRTADTR